MNTAKYNVTTIGVIILGIVFIVMMGTMLSNSFLFTREEPTPEIRHVEAYLYGQAYSGGAIIHDTEGNSWELVEGLDLEQNDKILLAINDNATPGNYTDDVIENTYIAIRPINRAES